MDEKHSDQLIAVLLQQTIAKTQSEVNDGEKTTTELKNDTQELLNLNTVLANVTMLSIYYEKENEKVVEMINYLEKESEASKDLRIQLTEQIRMLYKKEEDIHISTSIKLKEIIKNSFELSATYSDDNIDKQNKALVERKSEQLKTVAEKKKELEKLNQKYINCTLKVNPADNINKVVEGIRIKDSSLKDAKELLKLIKEKYERM